MSGEAGWGRKSRTMRWGQILRQTGQSRTKDFATLNVAFFLLLGRSPVLMRPMTGWNADHRARPGQSGQSAMVIDRQPGERDQQDNRRAKRGAGRQSLQRAH